MPTNVDYVRQLLEGFRSDPSIRWSPIGIPLNANNNSLHEAANLATQYMSMYGSGVGSAPSWADFQRLGQQYTAPDIFRGQTYHSNTGEEIQIPRTPGESGTSPWTGTPYTPPTGNVPTVTPGNPPPPPSPVSPPPISPPPVGAPPPPGNPTSGLLGGWNFGRNVPPPNNSSLAQTVGTAPFNHAGGMWGLSGNFSGTTRPPFVPQGYENWNPNDPRAQNPGQVSLANGERYMPRALADFYGAGTRPPYGNAFQQYGTAMAMSNPILPTFNWSRRTTTNNGGQ